MIIFLWFNYSHTHSIVIFSIYMALRGHVEKHVQYDEQHTTKRPHMSRRRVRGITPKRSEAPIASYHSK